MSSLIVQGEKNEILRAKSKPVENITDDLRALIKDMRKIMKEADGVGLAAPQIGKNIRLFVAEVNQKFYAVINPEIIKGSKEKETIEEGCLSLPGTYGPVERAFKVTLTGLNPRGKKLKIKAWGLLARVFQHELDHLDGKLFIDRAKKVYKLNDKNK